MTITHLIPCRKKRDFAPLARGVNPFFGDIGISNFFDRMFDDFRTGVDTSPLRSSGKSLVQGFRPGVNVEEDEEKILVTLEVPGMTEDNFDVSINDEYLTIRGEKKEDYEEQEGKSQVIGRSYGSFTRHLPLRAGIDHDKVDASIKNGLLTITLPKSEREIDKVKKINVSHAK